jgi:molecular chaperone GrpE
LQNETGINQDYKNNGNTEAQNSEIPEKEVNDNKKIERPEKENELNPEITENVRQSDNQNEDENSVLKDQLLRQAAEYDNYRKRTIKERLELEPEIKSRIVSEFLPVLDNVERALANECSDENYKKGVQLIYDGLLEILKKLEVEEVDATEFNPSYHQAVQQIQNNEMKSGSISSVFQKGYKIRDKVIRFAMVAVVS